MIVVVWRAGLRIQEALALAEHDLDPRRESLLVRNGRAADGARSAWTSGAGRQLRPWLGARAELPWDRCSASFTGRPAGDRGQAPPSARSSADSPFGPVSGAGLRRKGCATARA
jgi:hypothetical protein